MLSLHVYAFDQVAAKSLFELKMLLIFSMFSTKM